MSRNDKDEIPWFVPYLILFSLGIAHACFPSFDSVSVAISAISCLPFISKYIKRISKDGIHFQQIKNENATLASACKVFNKENALITNDNTNKATSLPKLKIDISLMTNVDSDIREIYYNSVDNFGELTDVIYTWIFPYVGAYEYGHSWILLNKRTNEKIKHYRMYGKVRRVGTPLEDQRTLDALDIQNNDFLIIHPVGSPLTHCE
jgi:hypothetical protein